MAEAGLEVSVGGLTLISLELYRYAYCSDLGTGLRGGGKKGPNGDPRPALADCRPGPGVNGGGRTGTKSMYNLTCRVEGRGGRRE
jgi:hypothetical protein